MQPLKRSAAEPTGFASFLPFTHLPSAYSLFVTFVPAGVSVFYPSLHSTTPTFSSTSVFEYLLVYTSPLLPSHTASTGFFTAIGSIDAAPSAFPPSPFRVTPFYTSLNPTGRTFFWDESEWDKEDFASTGTALGSKSTTSVPLGSLGSFGTAGIAGIAGIGDIGDTTGEDARAGSS